MKKIIFVFSIFLVFVLCAPFFSYAQSQTSGGSLRDLIAEKSERLKELQEQRAALEKNLETVAKSNTKLSKEIKTMDNTISQLDLLVKSNNLAIEKIELEIDSLTGDIGNTEKNIAQKKETIGKLFSELQQKDNENFLTIFLRNKSLAESVAEARTISTLNSNLYENLEALKNLQMDLTKKIREGENKKQEKAAEKVNFQNRQVILADQKKEKQVVLSQTKNQELIYEKQIEELTKLQDEISLEIEKIETEMRKNIDPNLLPLPRPGVLLWPVPEGRLTQGYGATAFAAKNYKSKYHNGLDMGRFLGAEIVAAEKGTVINVGDQDKFCRKAAYGKFIVIKHENGLTTLYGHLSHQIVSVGDKVERGQVIGYMGKTGWATGPHLHFTVFSSQTLTPARAGFPEGTQASRVCGPMPVGGDINPTLYLSKS
ncbi:MAG: peptidoglycan DD-metalloendopeptidase family protein [Patescibacteria group bacterium]